jgi:hypothetical protein
MSVFLRLGDAQLRQAQLRHIFADRFVQIFRREQCGHEFPERFRIFREPRSGCKFHGPGAHKSVEAGIEQRRRYFARTVGAEIRKQQHIAIGHAFIVADHRGQHELVTRVLLVGRFDRVLRRAREFAFRFDDGGIGLRHAVPAHVAIHGEVASRNCGDAHAGEPFDLVLKQAEISQRASGRRIAAVEKGMDEHRHICGIHDAHQCHDVILMAVHASRREQPHDMNGAIRCLRLGDQPRQLRKFCERTIRDRVVDSGQILYHHAASADVHVADFRIAHLAIRQTHRPPGRGKQVVRALGQHPLEIRRIGKRYGVVVFVRPPAPAIQNAKDGRFGTFLL